MTPQFLSNIDSIHSRFTQAHGWWLYGAVRALRPRRIVETGTCWGYMTAFLAMGLRANNDGGKLLTIDYYRESEPHATPDSLPIVRANLERCGVAEQVELIDGEALETLAGMAADGRLEGVGLVVLDDTHSYEHVQHEIEICWARLSPFGIIAGHDVYGKGLEGVNRAFREAAAMPDAHAVWSPESNGYCLLQKRSPRDEEPPR